MPLVTVYSFELYSDQQGAFVKAKGKCTKEKVESIGGRIIANTAQDVDGALLTETGRYHEEEQS